MLQAKGKRSLPEIEKNEMLITSFISNHFDLIRDVATVGACQG